MQMAGIHMFSIHRSENLKYTETKTCRAVSYTPIPVAAERVRTRDRIIFLNVGPHHGKHWKSGAGPIFFRASF
jgi:hypothetical protein